MGTKPKKAWNTPELQNMTRNTHWQGSFNLQQPSNEFLNDWTSLVYLKSLNALDTPEMEGLGTDMSKYFWPCTSIHSTGLSWYLRNLGFVMNVACWVVFSFLLTSFFEKHE